MKRRSRRQGKKTLKIALVHDYLREYGGAERVLEALHGMYPQAPVYVAFVDHKALGPHAQRFASWNIRTTWMQHIPFIRHMYSPLRVIAPKAFGDLDLSAFDIVISSSNAYFAKAVRVPNGVHLCYCHTPPRSLYGYSTMTNWRANLVTKVIGTLINHVCRVIDYQVAQRVTVFLANSQETARRIAKFYRRKSIVVHPPVELGVAGARAVRARTQRAYLLYVNRLAYAKHPELAIAAANALKLPLKVVGSGPMFEGLRRKAGPTVELLGSVSDQHLAKLYAGAECLLYPVEDEDFGIVPVEAMQFGTPVIAHASGGPLETIQENKTGLFFHKLTTAQLSAAIREARRIRWNHAAIARHGAQFSREVFVENMHLVVGATLKSNQP